MFKETSPGGQPGWLEHHPQSGRQPTSLSLSLSQINKHIFEGGLKKQESLYQHKVCVNKMRYRASELTQASAL